MAFNKFDGRRYIYYLTIDSPFALPTTSVMTVCTLIFLQQRPVLKMIHWHEKWLKIAVFRYKDKYGNVERYLLAFLPPWFGRT